MQCSLCTLIEYSYEVMLKSLFQYTSIPIGACSLLGLLEMGIILRMLF